MSKMVKAPLNNIVLDKSMGLRLHCIENSGKLIEKFFTDEPSHISQLVQHPTVNANSAYRIFRGISYYNYKQHLVLPIQPHCIFYLYDCILSYPIMCNTYSYVVYSQIWYVYLFSIFKILVLSIHRHTRLYQPFLSLCISKITRYQGSLS
jgi:hypothetical protein